MPGLNGLPGMPGLYGEIGDSGSYKVKFVSINLIILF